MADTIAISKDQRVLEISNGPVPFVGAYEFYMKPYPGNDMNLMFIYEEPKPELRAKVVTTKPDYPYRSWKSLFNLLTDTKTPFDDNYQLFITERLPGNKYVTHKVYRNIPKNYR